MFPPDAFARYDDAPDREFYRQPRLVEHIDDAAIDDVVRLHRERLPAGGEIIDLMSSWVSHLPADVAYARIVGLGMNAAELAANPRLDASVVHDLNADPVLPFADASFDAAIVCVSIQYLTEPVGVLHDLARVVRPGGPVAITFSNRCFPTKAVAIWQALDDGGHLDLVAHYLDAAGWRDVESIPSARRSGDPLCAVVAAAPPAVR
jgi:SAM-dependent methyltransferase